MSKETFQELCSIICTKVGDNDFKPETICQPHHVCGEVRVTIGHQILFGASYIDLVGRAFGVKSFQLIYNFFNVTIKLINETFQFQLVYVLV